MSITRQQRPSLQMADDLLLAWIGNRGKRCTAGEAAAQTGLPRATVETQLLALAVEAGGRLLARFWR